MDPQRVFASLTFPPGRPVIAAVSGGSDSMALLVLLDSFFRSHGRVNGLIAATVDHGLRPDSAAEARRVAAFCAARGIPHRTLAWQGPKPGTGVPAAAREARHRLLADAATASGAAMVLTGHTATDQAETIAMRRQRGEGRGLAGIAPATLHGGAVWFVRPLLSLSRAALRGLLVGEGLSWIDDPSNEQLAYERARVRQALAGADENDRAEDLLVQGRRSSSERIEVGGRAARLIDRHASLPTPGLVRFEAGLLLDEDDVAALLAFRLLLATVGGREHLPEAERARETFQRLASAPGRGSLGGAVVDRRSDAVFLHREVRAGWTGAKAAAPGTVWDGRFRITARGLPPGARVGAAGQALAAIEAGRFEGCGVPPALVRAALAAEPVVSLEETDGGILEETGGGVSPVGADLARALLVRVPSPYAGFLPSFDLAPAEALRKLVSADEFPPSPWRSHNAA
nr:tRNA lysidine(34) synthetase TilS [Aquibium carbonis]